MSKDKGPILPYFILKPAVSGELLYSMLGRVVQDPRRPNGPADFVPPEGIKPSTIAPDLYRHPVPGKDIETLKAAGHSVEARAQLSKMIDAFIKANRKTTEARVAPIYKRWDIAQPKVEIARLMQNHEYAKSVISFLEDQKDKKAALVITVLALADMEVSVGQESDLGAGGKAKAPLDAVAPGIELDVEGKILETGSAETKGTVQGQVVFALGYVEIKLLDREKKWYHSVTDLMGHKRAGNVEVSETYLNPDTGLYVGGSHIEGDLPYILSDGGSDAGSGEDEGGEAGNLEAAEANDNGSDKSIRLYF